MNTTRDSVVSLLRSRGQHDQAATACCCLPRFVDTRRDAIRLRELGLSEDALRRECRNG